MADWPLRGDGQRWVGGNAMGALDIVNGLQLTCALAPNYTATGSQLWAADALPIGASGVLISVWGMNLGGALCAFSIGYGTAPHATYIIQNLMVQGVNDSNEGHASVFLPVSIPPLTQVTMAGIASVTTTANFRVSALAVGVGSAAESPAGAIETLPLPVQPPTASTTYQGIAPPFAVSGTGEGAATAFGTTTRPWCEMIIAFGAGTTTNRTTMRYLVNIYIGSTLYIEGIPVSSQAAVDDVRPKYIGPIPVAIPAGSTLSATIRRDATSSDGPIRIALYGVS
jgi:hypothetical protein